MVWISINWWCTPAFCAFVFTPAIGLSQSYIPLQVSGFNLDAIAEYTPASASTGAAISNNAVLYSASYGTVFGNANGLPNNGVLSTGTHTYQLQPYNQNNSCMFSSGNNSTLSLNTPTQI